MAYFFRFSAKPKSPARFIAPLCFREVHAIIDVLVEEQSEHISQLVALPASTIAPVR